MKRFVFILAALPAVAMAQGWGNVAAPKEEVFTWAKWWTEPMFGGTWMAWTRASMGFFIFIFGFISVMALLEWRYPGGNERDGVLGLTTTRGDRLFIGLLGAAYILLAWVGLIGTPIWIPTGLALAWIAFSFWRV
jgi:predicted small integral membrane protein